MGDINRMIQWMKDHEGKVVYEQVRPWGTGNPPQYDCSAAVISALRAGGFMDNSGGNYGNTETLYGLEGKLLTPILREQVGRGDIFVSGAKGASGGNNGHTGIFLDNQTIIHSTPSLGGIGTSAAAGWLGGPPVYYYRLIGGNATGLGSIMGDIISPCFIEMNNGISWFDGKKRHNLPHKDCQQILNEIYRANNGKDMPAIKLKGADEAWLVRLDQAINAKS
ncbi:MAG: peptidoglycan amidohydrolase family protein [Enterococcus sp.]